MKSHELNFGSHIWAFACTPFCAFKFKLHCLRFVKHFKWSTALTQQTKYRTERTGYKCLKRYILQAKTWTRPRQQQARYKGAQTKSGVALPTAQSCKSQQILDNSICCTHSMDASSIIRALNRANSRRQVQQLAHLMEQREEQSSTPLSWSTTSAAPPVADFALSHKPSFDETITTQSLEDGDERNRQLQHVLRGTNRLFIVKRMIGNAEKYGEKGVKTRALQQFPEFLCRNYNANSTRTSCYWKDLHKMIIRCRQNRQTNRTSF